MVAPLALVVAAVLAVIVSPISMSESLLSRLPVVAMVSSFVVPRSSVTAVGLSLSPVMVMVTFSMSVAPCSSVTV